MSCPKNPQKRWGFFPYEGPHETFIFKMQRGSPAFIVYSKCVLCGSELPEVWNDPEMVRQGFDVEKLREVSPDEVCKDFSKEELEQFKEPKVDFNRRRLRTLIEQAGDKAMRELGWQRRRILTAEEQEEIDNFPTHPSFEDPSILGIKKLFQEQKGPK